MCDLANLTRWGGSRGLLGIALAMALIAPVTIGQKAWAQDNQPEAAAAAPPVDVVNQLTQTAVQLGALTCAARVQQVTSFLGVTPETRASLRRPLTPADRNSLSLAMTIQTDGVIGLGLAEFYPTQGGCKATYNLTVNLPQSCSDLRASGFASLNQESQLAPNITVLAGATSLRVILMDAGDGCTVTKTETLE